MLILIDTNAVLSGFFVIHRKAISNVHYATFRASHESAYRSLVFLRASHVGAQNLQHRHGMHATCERLFNTRSDVKVEALGWIRSRLPRTLR